MAFVAYFVWTVKNQKEPQFFPFNEPNAEYLISRDSTNNESPFTVRYKGPNNGFISENPEGYISVIVGSTKYDLNKFIGKKVFITKGDFVSSSKQCIASQCKDIYGPYVVVNIDAMQEVIEAKQSD